MRYDDRLATVLSGPDDGVRGRALRWRQVVDLLAQRANADDPVAASAFRWLRQSRAEVPLADRMGAARAVAGRRVPTELLLFFAGDAAVVAAPVVRGARLPAGDWLSILPRLGPTARALLRHRDDLPAPVARALGDFGASDLVLEGGQAPILPETAPDEDAGGGQIRNLVQRIEAFRLQREAERRAPPADAPDRIAAFRWECGPDGLLSWTDAPQRGALVGHALGGEGEAATADPFAARRPFRDLPAWLPAIGPVLLSGVPVFDGRGGRFTGYRGVGRSVERRAADAAPPPSGAVREMVHELRTPLNAIVGFAEMIAGEYLGPAAPEQRDRADEIRAQADRLMRALEDLDAAARADDDEDGEVDLQQLLVDEHPALEAQAAARGVQLGFRIEPGLPPAALAPEPARRMVRRLVGEALAGAEAGARVQLTLRRAGEGIALQVTNPAGPDADRLTARIVRNLIGAGGGRLEIEPDVWTVTLPAARRPERARATG